MRYGPMSISAALPPGRDIIDTFNDDIPPYDIICSPLERMVALLVSIREELG